MNKTQKEHSKISSIQETLKRLNISKKKNNDINILLLGETGVGKSTFINSFFNYISFPTLEKARCEKFEVVIPTQFTITDEDYKERTVKVGKDHNESIEVGASATQACRSYLYPVQGSNLKIRLIDTPGIGDTRGIEKDSVNFDNILNFIGELKYLNAICILLKPNNSRLTVMFEFCIKQLLSKLDKSASQNIIFVFTNTRSTFYRPGETLPPLKKLLGTIKDVNILCEKSNIFCTDNESFRFLAALKNQIKFSKDDVANFSRSWTKSNEECLRLILYIVGDENQMGLVQHNVKNTISVNEARRVLVQLSQPLAEIAQLIQENIRAVDVHRNELTRANMSVTELKAKMFIPIIDLKVTKLDQPTTVCTTSKCSEIYQVGGRKKWHYHQKCHSPCYLPNVPKEIIGSPELINCGAMANGECLVCSCKYQVHMHIYYETETFENNIEDEFVKTAIVSNEEARRHAQNMSKKMEQRLLQLNKEKEAIIKSTAKFACFLKTNAIVPYNDAYESYLGHLIDKEKSLDEASDFELIKQMEKMLQEYTEEKKMIMNAISQSHDDADLLTADEIIFTIQSLYLLNIFGVKIRELFQVQNRARRDENKSQNEEFIFTMKQKRQNKKNSQHRFSRQNNFQQQRNTQFRPNNVEPVELQWDDGTNACVGNPHPNCICQPRRHYPPPLLQEPLFSSHSHFPSYHSVPPHTRSQKKQTKSKQWKTVKQRSYNSEPETSYSRRKEQTSNRSRKHNLYVSTSSSDEYGSSVEHH